MYTHNVHMTNWSSHVAVDFHNTLEVNRTIPQQNIDAIRDLQRSNIKVTILSSCGGRRAVDVRRAIQLSFQDGYIPEVHTCYEKTGDMGKSGLCQSLSITTIFDDRLDVLRDCQNRNIETYHICHPRRHPCSLSTFQNLFDAVQAYLTRQRGLASLSSPASSTTDVPWHANKTNNDVAQSEHTQFVGYRRNSFDNTRPVDNVRRYGHWIEVSRPLPKYLRHDHDGTYLWWDQKSTGSHWQWSPFP